MLHVLLLCNVYCVYSVSVSSHNNWIRFQRPVYTPSFIFLLLSHSGKHPFILYVCYTFSVKWLPILSELRNCFDTQAKHNETALTDICFIVSFYMCFFFFLSVFIPSLFPSLNIYSSMRYIWMKTFQYILYMFI